MLPPSSTTAPRLSNSSRIPAPATTASTPDACMASASRSLRCCTWSVMSATSRCETSPISSNSAVARPGSSVCRWTLRVWLSPTTSTESPRPLELVVPGGRVEVLARDREVRAVAVGRRLVLRMRDPGRRVVGELRRLGAAQRRDHSREHHGQPVAAGVDDARLAQDRQQLGAAGDRQLARAERRLEHLGDHRVLGVVVDVRVQPRLVHVRDLGGHARGHLAHDGEDRPLGRIAHGPVGAVGGARHRGGDQHRVDQLAGARDQLLGRAAQQLREDHARSCRGRRAARRAPPSRRSRRARSRRCRPASTAGRAPASTARRVSAMLSPVSPSATGNTFRSLTSRRRVSNSASAPSTTALKRMRLGSATTDFSFALRSAETPTRPAGDVTPRLGLGDLAGLQTARANVHALRRAAIGNPHFLKICVEPALGRDHRV